MFDSNKPEGSYNLDLALVYDRLVLRELLTISSQQVEAFALIEQPIEQKQCFYQVKLDGKPKWDVPVTKNDFDLWDIP